MKSTSSDRAHGRGHQNTPGRQHRRVTRWVLGAVSLLALMSAAALWHTLRQAHELSRASQFNDLWYVSSVNSELLRVSLPAPRDEVQLRLDVLYSVLDQSPDSPRVQVRLRERVPGVFHTLDELAHAVDRWSHLLADTGDVRAVMREASTFHDRMAQAVAEVHQAATLEAERERHTLALSFMLLSGALTCLLLGTAVAIWRARRAQQVAVRTSRALNEVNLALETRVRDRTRRIDESRNLLTFILDASPSDVALIEVDSGRVHFINQRLRERLGLDDPPRPLRLSDLLHDADTGRLLHEMLDESGQADNVEALLASDPPSWSALSARLIEVEGRLCHLVWGFDISTHKRLEDELRTLACTDGLSGLNNRRAFLEKGTRLLEHCRRYQIPCGVLMVDIDHFKLINDHHGHPVGDEAIRATARAVLTQLREADVVGRLGGEEFAVLVPHAEPDSVRETAERLRRAVQALTLPLHHTTPLRFTVSIGYATLDTPDLTLDALLNRADQALYQAKSEGRNRVAAFSAIHPCVTHPSLQEAPHP